VRQESAFVFSRSDDISRSLLQRELCWLLKDQIHDGNGWGFAHGNVDPLPPYLQKSASFLESQTVTAFSSSELLDYINSLIGGNGGFVVPYGHSIDYDTFLPRVSGVAKAAYIQSMDNPGSKREFDSLGSYWENGTLPAFFDQNTVDSAAAFNIAHPYTRGPLYDLNDDKAYEIESDGVVSRHGDDGPIFTLMLSTDNIELAINKLTNLPLLNRLPKGTAESPSRHADINPKYDMVTVQDELGIKSGATCGGSILVKSDADIDGVPRLTEALDTHGFSLTGITETSTNLFLLYKLRPRHTELHGMAPEFDGAFEERKLRLTEWSRNMIPGHRYFGGERRTVLDSFDGWDVVVEKPARKDADDFVVQIEGPDDTKIEATADQAPFDVIFADVQANIRCKQSGLPFMKAIWELYQASDAKETELTTLIPTLANDLPPHSDSSELRYPHRRVLLWLLGLLFIVEDINYRFSFHGVQAGRNRIKYRKQGREQPMNALLKTVARTDEDVTTLFEQAEGGGDLPGRPDEFHGPEHLSDWFDEHVLDDE